MRKITYGRPPILLACVCLAAACQSRPAEEPSRVDAPDIRKRSSGDLPAVPEVAARDGAAAPGAKNQRCAPNPGFAGNNAGAAAGNDPLANLNKDHPRLLVTPGQLATTRSLTANDVLAKAMYESHVKAAEAYLKASLVQYGLDQPEKVLLERSREILARVITLAGVYLLDGDAAKAKKARDQLLAAAAFPDWHPGHFLDTAEMTEAIAIGYDWLYDYLSEADRQTIRAAIIQKGLKAGLDAYARNEDWTHRTNNWAQVCAAGLTTGALAIADSDPAVARQVLVNTKATIARPMAQFAPDGGWPEGPMYWGYATRYSVLMIAALRTALGTDWGLSAVQGFSDTGRFIMQDTGPTKLFFNFGDAYPQSRSAPQMFWLAREFQRPEYTRYALSQFSGGQDTYALFWYDQACANAPVSPEPLDFMFKNVQVAVLRSAWDDPNAFFVGFKGGSNKASHTHLDLGSFVLDALGQRWAADLGVDDYSLPGYFTDGRSKYYRLRTEGHNTLTISASTQQPLHFASQSPDAQAPIVAFLSSPERSFVVANLTEAYAPAVSRALRGVALLNKGQVIIQDEVTAAAPVDIVWNFHTLATVQVAGRTATLSLGNQQFKAEILAPTGATFATVSANPTPISGHEDPNAGVTNLIARLPSKTKSARIVVRLAPVKTALPAPALQPLDQWIAAGKLSAL